MKGKTPDALSKARDAAMARAAQEAANQPPQPPDPEWDIEECFVRLAIDMFSLPCKVGLGVMPDGMALFGRVSVPTSSTDHRAGAMAFVVSDEPQTLLRKLVSCLDDPAYGAFWKPDRFAQGAPKN